MSKIFPKNHEESNQYSSLKSIQGLAEKTGVFKVALIFLTGSRIIIFSVTEMIATGLKVNIHKL
jgi:hypothetical protein